MTPLQQENTIIEMMVLAVRILPKKTFLPKIQRTSGTDPNRR